MMFYTNHKKEHAWIAVFYRNFKEYGEYGEYGDYGEYGEGYCHSHIGLGINAIQTCRVLRKHQVRADPVSIWDVKSIAKWLTEHSGVTHALIEAPWVSAQAMAGLLAQFPGTHFIVRSHSQIGFLQVEPDAVKNLRDLMVLQEAQLNFSVAVNTERLREFMRKVYKKRVLYLPNLYDAEREGRKRDVGHDHRTLRIGSFGALRPLKNHTTAAAAALMIAERRGSDLEFFINCGRKENEGAGKVATTIKLMFAGLRWAKVVEVPWEDWPVFRHTVAHMDLCIQVSFSETFNIVTADSVAEGVPSVVGPAIEWVPHSWKASTDSVEDIARVGSHLLSDTRGAEEGLQHLEKYVHNGVHEHWLKFLDSNPT